MLASHMYRTADSDPHSINKQVISQKKNDFKTLYVSGLRNDVKKMDIRRHFTGCVKVTIKQHQTRQHLKYAIKVLITILNYSIFIF
jgi:RNA recognition motif-containing protein